MNPTATRAGIPSVLAIAANVPENCSQYPTRFSRKFTIADELCPSGISVLYVNVVRNQSWSVTIRSKFVVAPAVTSAAVSAITGGRSSGSARNAPSGGSSDVAAASASTVKRGIADRIRNVSPSSRSSFVLISDAESAKYAMPIPSEPAETGSGATGRSGPSSASMTSTWSFSTAAADCAGNVSPSPSTSFSATSHRLPSKRGSAEIRQYDGAVAVIVNICVSAWLTIRDRMSTSGLTISVTPPRPLWVSNSGSAFAPGRCGATAQAPATTSAAAPSTPGATPINGWRARPSTVRGRRSRRNRRSARARKPAPTTARLHSALFSSTPNAAMNTNSTAPGTSASPRAWARKANVSESHTVAAVVAPARNAHPPL